MSVYMSKYKSGSYSANAKGMSGEIKVKVTVDEDNIKDVDIDVSCESIIFGGMAGPHLRKRILEAQSSDVDAVTSATTTSNAVKEATRKALNQAKIK